MRQFNVLFRWGWTFLLVVTLGLAGCDGDDGAAGVAGAPGGPGPAGPAGPPGPGASVTPLESCAVCHDAASIADAAVAHALPPIEAVSGVTLADVGGDLVVNFSLAVDGALNEDYDAVQRAYFTDSVTRIDLRDLVDGDAEPPETLESEGVATLSGGAGGDYTITVPAATFAALGTTAADDGRWLFRVAAGSDRETRVYFYADIDPLNPVVGPAAVSAESCTACHGPEGIDVHGGYYAAADGAEPCLTCHGVDTTPSLAAVAHGYHNGIWEEEVPRGSGNFEPIEITYPTYMNNCSVCHEAPDLLAAANSMSIDAASCFSCHGSIATIPFGTTGLETLHSGVTEATDCMTGCHMAGGLAQNVLDVTDVHNGATTGRGGVIWDGEDTSVTEGARIAWTITAVEDDGVDLSITWGATYDNGTGPVAVNPCNDTVGVGAPAFYALPPFTFAGDDEPTNRNNLSILRNYAQGEDFILGAGANAGQPGSSPGVSADNTTCDGFAATTVVPVEVDETYAMYGRVAIQGKPWVAAIDPDDEDGVMQVRAKTPTYDWAVGDGAAAPARRAVADTSLCLSCHVGSLYQHGGNRVDNIDMCYLCHNPAANDQYVRAGFGVDASESYDGRAGQAFGIKEMVHGVHPAGATGNPWVVYRGRGIYAFADDVDALQNWPTGDNCTQEDDDTGSNYFTVVGSEDAPAGGSDTCQPHNFESPTYPRGLYDCAACHVATVNILPDPTKAMATTVEAGDAPFSDQLNDVLEGVQTSSCVTCHADSASKGHAYQNGWVPQEFPEGRTIIDAN